MGNNDQGCTLEIVIDGQVREPRLVLHVAALTNEVTELAKRLQDAAAKTGSQDAATKTGALSGSPPSSLTPGAPSGSSAHRLLGYRNEETVLLEPQDIYSFFTQGQTVQARTRYGTLRIKQRLYELEELLDPTMFLRVSHSELVNFKHVRSFEVSINGSINLKFADGNYAYVSRRNLKAIKEYLGA